MRCGKLHRLVRRRHQGTMRAVPGPKRVANHYIGPHGAQYSSVQVRTGNVLAATMARTFQPHIAASDVVLDFGCGGGALLSNLICARRLGVEPLHESAVLARSRGVDVTASIEEVQGEPIDVVISYHALEHCTEPFTELTHILHVLKRRGRLVLVVPIQDWRVERRAKPDDVNHHLFAWTPLLMGNLLSEVGFAEVQCSVISQHWDPRFVGLPWPLFRLASVAEAIILKRRQLLAIAIKS